MGSMGIDRGNRAIVLGVDDSSPVGSMSAVNKSTRQTASVGRHEVLVIFWITRGLHLWRFRSVSLSIGLRVLLPIFNLLLLLAGCNSCMIRCRILSPKLSILMDSLGFFQFLCRELNGILLLERLG